MNDGLACGETPLGVADATTSTEAELVT